MHAIHDARNAGLSTLGLSYPVSILVPHFMLIRVSLPPFQKWAKSEFEIDLIMAIEWRILQGAFAFVPKDFFIHFGRDIVRSVGAG